MSDDQLKTEIAALNAAVLPDPVEDLAVTPARKQEIAARLAELDMTDTGSIIAFGAGAQSELQAISETMLSDVRNKDVGPAGESLREMVTTIRGFSVDELDPNRKPSWWDRLRGKSSDVSKFFAKYEVVQDQLDEITGTLEKHEYRLAKDIKALDQLYGKTLDFYDGLTLYIAAGEQRLNDLDADEIPAKQADVDAAAPDDQVLLAQDLRDLRAARDDLDRRVHDLRLTRQVTMQSLPSIRLVQENDKALITKINSTLTNTVPLWKTQLAQAVTIQRSASAAAALQEASDLTNDLLTSNAANLRSANAQVREQTERGIYDIEAIKTANSELISTIEDSLRIADEGKARRQAAEQDLSKMETELRDALAAAKARTQGG